MVKVPVAFAARALSLHALAVQCSALVFQLQSLHFTTLVTRCPHKCHAGAAHRYRCRYRSSSDGLEGLKGLIFMAANSEEEEGEREGAGGAAPKVR